MQRTKNGRRRTAVVLAAFCAVNALGAGAASADAATRSSQSDSVVQTLIKHHTGKTASALDPARPVHGRHVRTARNGSTTLPTYVQNSDRGFAVMAVLQPGQSTARFDGLLTAGERVEPNADGGLAILAANNLVGSVEAPWALDATGRALPTRYSVEGTSIVQSVDTTNATFPVVADPSVATGYYIVPVFYVQYTWTETNYINTHIAYSSPAAALLCSRTGVAAPFCTFFAAALIIDVTNTTRDAIAHKRCLKQRLPATFGAVGLPAYDSYYVTCTS